ncbi:sesquipedalian-1-like [Aplochiton taeniatus]
MKIHKKILRHFQACNSPVDKEGYLNKKGERNTSYQKRWFVLKGNLLFYKDRPADRDLIGFIVLEDCSVQLCESEEPFAFSLVWNAPGLRTYKLAAEDQASQESWIKALLSANHRYLDLLLMDLEKQYREAMRDPNRSSQAGIATQLVHPPPWLNAGASILLPYTGQGVKAAPTFHAKPSNKKSPRLWPKKNGNIVPINGPTPPQGEWSISGSGSKEEFSQLHEEFGKEVKELIVDWLKKENGNQAAQEKDLIDFG